MKGMNRSTPGRVVRMGGRLARRAVVDTAVGIALCVGIKLAFTAYEHRQSTHI
ncbi:MAG TPA: hypothetical protein VMS08_02870 [Candidatus Saccharimonadia bacterium]|nr:hypothetical protein [Candidatus Saccharimonadia bacterium]